MTLPANVATAIEADDVAAHIQHLNEFKTNIAHAANLHRLVAVRMVDEPSPAAARATDKILRNPK